MELLFHPVNTQIPGYRGSQALRRGWARPLSAVLSCRRALPSRVIVGDVSYSKNLYKRTWHALQALFLPDVFKRLSLSSHAVGRTPKNFLVAGCQGFSSPLWSALRWWLMVFWTQFVDSRCKCQVLAVEVSGDPVVIGVTMPW